jgi:hypothetical protein
MLFQDRLVFPFSIRPETFSGHLKKLLAVNVGANGRSRLFAESP